MALQWTCNEHECGFVATATEVDELIEQVNAHMRDQHDSYELEEMIEDAAVEVSDEA